MEVELPQQRSQRGLGRPAGMSERQRLGPGKAERAAIISQSLRPLKQTRLLQLAPGTAGDKSKEALVCKYPNENTRHRVPDTQCIHLRVGRTVTLRPLDGVGVTDVGQLMAGFPLGVAIRLERRQNRSVFEARKQLQHVRVVVLVSTAPSVCTYASVGS